MSLTENTEKIAPQDSAQTDFGFKKVPSREKAARVADVFHSVANKYDLMNDLMSLGIHRLWKRLTVEIAEVRPGYRILDLAGGTGDLAIKFSELTGEHGEVVLSDINASMLQIGRDRMVDAGCAGNSRFAQADAESLPFPENSFDIVSIGFGLRNVTNKENALAAIYHVLKPGGKLLVLEFSKPQNPLLESVYDTYSFQVLPLLGKLIANDSESYQYLAESIRMHPDQETLRQMILDAGFAQCEYHNLTGGIVALHCASK
ncbi:MAG: bifunctional demethylmenaquinone methyltransferase/2-methoxy-6-polyprenyl-1,4-benzoquinol methylase UbiE [Pseudomonadales bacterium]|nr:bifunctional demethylmenaquinone methyltransferase/2-methoxy-6-polyprenyl-1,4-benzoquinol methylase UbiE [Pseudomonadales bacterium]NNL11556.1 bifunctional demethylmenaquinone methyltransferase/2-methoxy-6-polyprenyl-1,4-benzoquinol methylase UbiE [Pseudomonadales bacterium]NNM11756.1 bifunctional demethylmenaquinone methyltransferase/2-methoxy-6-polyprenyl-1,4-benzoquinol methylase UbiE [Pseudomonadales bacterium]